MAKEGFNRDYTAVSDILKHDAGVQALLKVIADGLAAEVDGQVEQYETDRAVFGIKRFWTVKVDAEKQARDGALTKAVGRRGKTIE